MYKFKKSLIGLIGGLSMVAIATIGLPHIGRSASRTSSSAPTSQTQNVNVVNTPSVNAQQSGTWNVGINGTPTVGIDVVNNTVKIDTSNPLPVQDVDNPARHPFQAEGFGEFNSGSVSTGDVIITTVPAGKRLVIEHVSMSARMIAQAVVQAKIRTTLQDMNNGNPVDHLLVITPQGVDGLTGQNQFVTSEETRLYADPGTIVTMSARRDNIQGDQFVSVTFSISGYVVDVP